MEETTIGQVCGDERDTQPPCEQVPEDIGFAIPHETVVDAMREDGSLPAIPWQDVLRPVVRKRLSAQISDGVRLSLHGPDAEYPGWWGKIELSANKLLGDSTSTVGDNTRMLLRDLLPEIEEGMAKLCAIRDCLLSDQSSPKESERNGHDYES